MTVHSEGENHASDGVNGGSEDVKNKQENAQGRAVGGCLTIRVGGVNHKF